ncbi:MAG: recombinase family protein [Oscillospiraceae bacterium]|nr:recombinase family protein [Oscillospiraceae bacterium]
MGRTKLDSLRRVAIYGRVSTEHEAQLSAFENQQVWYENIVEQHADWLVVDRYYDEGITGTAAQKRPAFLRMLEDARQHRFDLIVTREVCRFARNTVDTLTVTRELSRIGVEVYFVSDNIWTMDGDGELRLTIMATLAQEESRKISERTRAGQQISREKGVLYGTGNIMGYERAGGTYVINPEQAYVVRKIFELYASGMGYKTICAELMRLGCKNAHGEVSWKIDRIGRILRNATYKGYLVYNKSHSDGYLTQKRVNHSEEDYVVRRGDFPAIVSEALWNRCEAIRLKKNARLCGPDGKPQKFGRKEPKSVWSDKLRCSCGSSFRRILWHENANGQRTYGYECYRRKRSVTVSYLKEHGLDEAIVCQAGSIPYWHIDMMASAVFRAVWQDRREAVLLACQMLEECAEIDIDQSARLVGAQQVTLDRLHRKQAGLREMRALGDITREEFLSDNQRLQEEIERAEQALDDLKSHSGQSAAGIDIAQIKKTLERWIDLSAPVVSDALIEQFILQVAVVDDNTFNWTLDLSNDSTTKRLTPSRIAQKQYYETLRGKPDPTLDPRIREPKELFSFTLTAEDAAAYCASIGIRFFRKKWHDKTVIISL